MALRIDVPILPGIFPILNYNQIIRIASLAGVRIPTRLREKVEQNKDRPQEVEKYGIEYAIIQVDNLIKNEIAGLHLYCMNKSHPVKKILAELALSR
jgi:methylenetetrahydrofolate reductase (NADPH)